MDQLDRYFEFKCLKGLEQRIQKLPYKISKDLYLERLKFEIQTIQSMHFSGYFLVVADFINWAKSKNILVGDGRGSGAGSLAAYSLGITNVDPIKYDLYFERFLNPDRVSMPDFDVDFQKDRRDEVIEYVRNKYGSDKVAQIGTFGTFKAKGAIRGVARTLNIPIAKADVLCKLWPKPEHGKEVGFEKAYKTVPHLKDIRDSNTDEGLILRWAEQMEERVASYGIHASGIVIANDALVKFVPLAKGKNNEVVTQWDMKAIEEVGLIKFDFLGLKTLTTISTALQNIKKNHGVDIDISHIKLDDEATYSSLRKGDNIGIFQLEASSGIRDLTIKVRPNNIEDISAINAIYRPGPLASDKLPPYLEWRAGAKAQYLHPDLEPILSATGGWIIYQEQVLRIARDLAGYTLGEADLLRRAVGKKKEDEMREQHKKFIDGMKAKGYSVELGDTLWEEIKAFADYGFNKSHAVAYSVITYQTAYLKTHYPVEFMAAALTCDAGNQDQKIIYIQECKRMGIPVLPPDINESGLDFTPKGSTIRFGLNAIKNVGAAAEHIITEREARGPFKDLFDFAERVDLSIVNKTKLDSLVMAGAFDFTHQNRATLITAVDLIIAYKDQLKSFISKTATYEKKLAECEQRVKDIAAGLLSDKGKKLKPLSPPVAPMKPSKPNYILVDEYSKRDLLIAEKELTGSFISGHPLDNLKNKGLTIYNLKHSGEQPDVVTFSCIISDIELKETKTKARMAFLSLEDLTGTIDAVIFPKEYMKYQEIMLKNIPIVVGAKVEYKDVETDDGYITIPSLLVQKIDLLGTQSLSIQETSVDVPLQIDSVLALKKAITKSTSGESKVRIRFNTKSSTILSPIDLIGVSNEREFRAEVYKQIKK